MTRSELFRLLGDEDRLRLLALCAEDELTVGELASLLGESQPQITKKSQPLREQGLLAQRRDGTRTLLRAQLDHGDVVLDAAIAEGRALCAKDGSLSRVAAVVLQREDASRQFFDDPGTAHTTIPEPSLGWLPIIAPLLPGRALAIDAGTGDGALLPILSPLFDRVVAVDRSASRLARCTESLARWRLTNVRLREGDIDDGALVAEIDRLGGADVVVMARVLHHAARPPDSIAAAARLLRPSGHLIVVDYLPHDDETMREQGDVWLGFESAKLRSWLAAHLAVVAIHPLAAHHQPTVLPLQIGVARKPSMEIS